MEGWLLKVHLLTTIFMVGLVWFVQVLHYPGFLHIRAESFQGYHKRYLQFSGFLIAPVMLVELGSGAVLVFLRPGALLVTNMVLLGLIWLSTFLLQVPYHNRLSGQYDQSIVRKLVNTNWLRTVFWSARALILLYLL